MIADHLNGDTDYLCSYGDADADKLNVELPRRNCCRTKWNRFEDLENLLGKRFDMLKFWF